ncbi:group II intron reverse transcriptase domain-containing protein [Candidatus Kaiserbacteria bacterium]|nr:group II intron reverse transcriptase domain-containing protein [Candidatus Kaiserbacteria bacterium]USN92062.1 MAG: group II intron reverse transcriptase domain-containing protein [Candidatus Nomurabacteria bacterium]
MKTFTNLYTEITDTKNLFLAWKVFRRGKTKKKDVLRFEWELEQNIFALHRDLKNKSYRHGTYKGFYITDPKRRHIHKATVRDRVLHHAIYNKLYPLFDPLFIATSFSCRVNKGTHKGVLWLEKATRKVSKNYTKPCFVLKCDIRRFFDSVDHSVLIGILNRVIDDVEVVSLLEEIIGSFSAGTSNLFERKGIPIGNLTSQLFANIYMNEFDQFMKHTVKAKHYARYTDDFVVVADNEQYLIDLLKPVSDFLGEHLKLSLHPNKVSVHKLHNGADYLGYVVLPHYKRLRTKTRRRVYKGLMRKVRESKSNSETAEQSLNSYLGALSHASEYKVSEDLKNLYWFLMTN